MLMKDSMVTSVVESMPAVTIALFGSLVALFAPPEKKFSFKMFLGGLLAAAFVGLIINVGLVAYDVNEHIRIISVALGGYSARDVLELVSKKFLDKVKKELDEEDDDDDDDKPVAA